MYHQSAPRIKLCHIFQICADFFIYPQSHICNELLLHLVSSVCITDWFYCGYFSPVLIQARHTLLIGGACLLAPWMHADDFEDFNSAPKYVLSDFVCTLLILYLLAMLKRLVFCIIWHMSQTDSWLSTKHLLLLLLLLLLPLLLLLYLIMCFYFPKHWGHVWMSVLMRIRAGYLYQPIQRSPHARVTFWPLHASQHARTDYSVHKHLMDLIVQVCKYSE